MAGFFKFYYENREGSANKGKWYARAVHTGTVTIDDLADEMQANCTVKRADIVAVLSELVETMQKHLQMSHRVKLDRVKAGPPRHIQDRHAHQSGRHREGLYGKRQRQVGARAVSARDQD